jgi:hypothetical protein
MLRPMRGQVLTAFAFFGAALGIFSPGSVGAHGSLPISQQIMWRGDTMMVPAAWWGLFIGTDGGSWQWICEEAVNSDQSRIWARTTDGTLYATDISGITISRDNGCTWADATSGVNMLELVDLKADPVRARAWALAANSNDDPDNGIWTSDDTGLTWQRPYPMPDYLPTGLAISDDGMTIIVGSVTNGSPRTAVLHVSTDGGMSFTPQPLTYQIDGGPLAFSKPLWIDPKVPGHFYLSTGISTGQALLLVDDSAQVSQVAATTGIFDTMSYNPTGDELLAGSTVGLYSSKNGGPFTMLSTLGSAQCLSVHNNLLYACAWNYEPDEAAIARLSDDASSFTKVFQFNDTQQPITCPASSPVQQICPMIWENYADQLGVQLNSVMGNGTPSSTPPASSGCAFAGRSQPENAAPVLWLSLFGLLGLLSFRRKARSK